MARKNLLPPFSAWEANSGVGTEVSDSLTVSDDGYSASFAITHESSSIICKLDQDDIKGHTVLFHFDLFSSSPDNDAWLNIRLYNADKSDYTEINKYQKKGDFTTEAPFDLEIEIPSDCGRLYIRFRHNYHTDAIDPPATITITNVSLYDTYAESLTALNFHKVMKENLPSMVEPGTQHIYYTTDGSTVEQYISNKEGYLIPVGATSGVSGSEGKYTNAYTQQHIDERKEEIVNLTKQGHCIVFAIATDIHVRIEDGEAGRYNQVRDFIMLADQLPLDYVICEGDIMSYCQDWDGVFEPRAEKVMEIFKQMRCPWWATRGNHDYNDDDYGWQNNSNIKEYTPENCNSYFITDQDWHRSITSKMPVPIGFEVHFDNAHPHNGYFYVDDYLNRHRIIMCNSEETMETDLGRPYINEDGVVDAYISGVESKAQLQWLFDKAMDMTGKTDWVVSFHSHTAPYTDAAEEDKSEFHGYGGDNQKLRKVVKAFQDGTAVQIPQYGCIDVDNHAWITIGVDKDFTGQGPIKVLGWFGGHCHDDNYRKVDGLNVVVSTCTCSERRTDWKLDPAPIKLPPERNSTNLAMSVNVFVVNLDTRTINLVKVGSKRDNSVKTSSDRGFTY